MLTTKRTFSYQKALVGVIIGVSIGLGSLSLDNCIGFGAILGIMFGYKGSDKTIGEPHY